MQFNYQSFIVLSILVAAANADASALTSALNQIVEDAGATDSAVTDFSADKGLTAALTIQESSTKLSKDLDAALSAASGVDSSSSSDVASAFAKLQSPVTSLLSNLVKKASDFAKVGTTSIVQNDLDELQGKSNKLLAAVYGIVACGKDGDSAGSVGTAIYSGFVQADSVYSVNGIDIAQTTCQGNAPESSAAAPSSSAAGSSAAAPSSSAAAASSAAGSSAAGSSAAAPSGAASAPVAAGAGQAMVNTGVGLLAVGAAALLM